MSIPQWDRHGVVPPIRPGLEGHALDRSPYRVEVRDLVERFGTSEERRAILGGFLRLRAALAEAGLTEGFQWIDGSFLEDIERMQERPPRDLDVVTFARLGDADRQRRLHAEVPHLFSPERSKHLYTVDHYFLNLSLPLGGHSVRKVSYWYSMWSHRRADDRWKGFAEVPLESTQTSDALAILHGLESGGSS